MNLIFFQIQNSTSKNSPPNLFRQHMLDLSPPWLANGRVGKAMMQTFGTSLDMLLRQLMAGVKARFPSYAPDDIALGYIGNDRIIYRGPAEAQANYRNRLNGYVSQHQIRGNGRSILNALAGWFNGLGTPPLRLVSNGAVWHEYDWNTGFTNKTVVGNNWNWDGVTTSWWRGWVIIDASSLSSVLTPALLCGAATGGTWDDGAVCGTGASAATVQSIQRIVQTYKPANVYVTRIIITFSSSLYLRTNSSPPNPNGNMNDPSNFSSNACYLAGGGEEPT